MKANLNKPEEVGAAETHRSQADLSFFASHTVVIVDVLLHGALCVNPVKAARRG